MLPGTKSNTGALFATSAAPPVGTPFVAGMAVSPEGRLYVQGLGSTWSPSELFVQNEQGAWYDPSDLSTMFQDSAGTTPVTGVGQPVGLILDKSGNDNHASQATAASRPLLQNDGVNNYLAFDGVDDSLSTTSFDLSLSTTVSMFFGLDKINDTNAGWLIENSIGNTSGVSFCQRGTSFEIGFKTASNDMNETISPYAAQQKLVISALIDPTKAFQERIDIRVDTIPVEGSLYGAAGVGDFGNSPMFIGKRIDGYPLGFNSYSLIVLGRLATTDEIDQTEAWVNSKTGAY